MASIAFLGLGLMGTPMAARLVEAGHDVCVWNRTTAKTRPLADRGATVAHRGELLGLRIGIVHVGHRLRERVITRQAHVLARRTRRRDRFGPFAQPRWQLLQSHIG